MYRLYGPSGVESPGYPPRAFENIVQQNAGAQVGKMLETLLTTTSDPDVDAAFDYYGLKLERNPLQDAAYASGIPIPAEFGLTWKLQESLLIVETVYKGSAAAAAGVLPGDELLAINEQRVDRLTIQDRMLRLLPGENAELLLVRNGRIRNLTLTVQEARFEKYRVIIKPDISKREKRRLSNWLGTELTFIKN
jgi:predicted metalloprotease with PDZ domain